MNMNSATDVREDLIALEAEVTILRNDLNKMSSRCATLVDMLNILLQEKSVIIENTSKEDNQVEMFDTGEPTSAYVNQDR